MLSTARSYSHLEDPDVAQERRQAPLRDLSMIELLYADMHL